MKRERGNGSVHADELVRLYRQAVEWEDVCPGEHVRAVVLGAAQQKAGRQLANRRGGQAKTATGTMPQAQKREAANDTRWRMRALGSLAVLGLVGLLASRFLPGTGGYAELARTLPLATDRQPGQAQLASAPEDAPVAAAAESVVPAALHDAETVLAETPIRSAAPQANKQHRPQNRPLQDSEAHSGRAKARDGNRLDRGAATARKTESQTEQGAPVEEKPARIAQTEPSGAGLPASRMQASPFPGDAAERAPSGFGQAAPGQIDSGQLPVAPDAAYPGDAHAMKRAPLAHAPDIGRAGSVAPMPQSASRAQAVAPHGAPRPVVPEAAPALRARQHGESLHADTAEEAHAARPDKAAKAAHHRGAGALLAAARRGDLARVRQMVRAGVPVDARDGSGRTALMHAAAHGHLAVVRYLLQQQADAGLVDHAGQTAAAHARSGGHEKIAREVSGKP